MGQSKKKLPKQQDLSLKNYLDKARTYLILVATASTGGSVKISSESNFLTTNAKFYTQCVLLHTVCNLHTVSHFAHSV